jgi:hypothetical protein
MQLLRSGGPIATIFDLLGSKEDDMTYSLGYVASRSNKFMDALVSLLAGQTIAVDHAVVRLQTTSAEHRGRTDVEVQLGQDFFCIFEAKRGPWLPDEPQLRRYVPILLSQRANIKRLVAVTNAPDEYAQLALPRELDGIPVRHVSWRTIKRLAEHVRGGETNRNKQLLDEFATYLKGILGMAMAQSNLVYVVSLGAGGSWSVDFREVVQRQRRYFYPLEGGGWPEPPNYIAFRYDGRLQTIHHVDSFDVFTNPRTLFAEAEDVAVKPHYCLRLGPPIRPAKEVPNGFKIRMAMRVWCAIDTLLTSDTITDAMAETKRRLGNEAPPEGPLEAGEHDGE